MNEPTAESWDSYWRGTRHGAALCSDRNNGTSHSIVLSFWDDFFKSLSEHYRSPRIVDVASGSGAIVERAEKSVAVSLEHFTCVDISPSAIALLTERYPGVQGLVADARAIPLGSEEYDVATSQFGIEYAGLEAIGEMARLVSPGGRLALLLHHRNGGIYKQCSASLDAINKMQDIGFVERCIEMFEAGFGAITDGSKSEYTNAAKRFTPALRAIEAIMKQYGTEVADGTIVRFYKDVRTVHGRMANYQSSEVLEWLQRMQSEIQTFGGRMASMCDAAIDAKDFERTCAELKGSGFEVLLSQSLEQRERSLPLAWALIAMKQ